MVPWRPALCLGLVATIALVVLIWRGDLLSTRTPAQREATQVRPSATELKEQSPDAASPRQASQESGDSQESDASDSGRRGAAYYEDLIRHFAEDRRFGGIRLTGELVVIEVLEKWKAIQLPIPGTASEAQVMILFVRALRVRYRTKPIDKAQRYFASVPLVRALTDPSSSVRMYAYDALHAIYTRMELYNNSGSVEERRRSQRRWEIIIEQSRDS